MLMRGFLKEVSNIWVIERPSVLAAALAYYGIFALVPIIYVAFTLAGMFIDALAAADRLSTRLETVFGPQVVDALESLMAGKPQPTQSENVLVSIISFLALLFAASGLFYQLQYALNKIWQIPPPEMRRPATLVRQYLFSFLMVLGVGLLLIIATLVNLLIAWLGQLANSLLGIEGLTLFLTVLGSLAILTFCLALLYKVLPQVKITWRDVIPGAALTAVLIMLAAFVMGLYFKFTSGSTAMVVAGSTAVILVGIYYFAQIFLFGAVFTRAYSVRYGSWRSHGTPEGGGEAAEIKKGSSEDGAPPS
jgi:membrane protein